MGVGSALKLFSQKNEMMLVELPENEKVEWKETNPVRFMLKHEL